MRGYTATIIAIGCILLASCTTPIRQVSGADTANNDPNSKTATDATAQNGAGLQQMTQGYADIPIPTNDVLIVSESLLFNTGEQWIGRAVLESELDASKAFEYYREKMPEKGWIGITKVQSNVSILTFEKGNRVATVQIEQRLVNKSSIKVTVSPREVSAVTN